MRCIAGVLAALLFTTAAAAPPKHAQGPFTLDSRHKCRAAGGQIVVPRLCHVRPLDCRDPKTQKYVACNAPGAVRAD